ncbi:MAG: hypothetical protein K9H16_12170 [Bacteroidales bacterium]|nr:hypothetical protein [Bacteroidales bacterium]
MKLIFTVVLFLLINLVSAQEVVQSIGLRAGGGSGFTYKYIEDYNYAFEGILSYRENGFQVTGLWERYKPFMTDRLRNFYSYWGFGAHAGYIRAKEQFCVQTADGCELFQDRRTRVVGGLDGVMGFEYHFYSAPLAVSLDYKPFVEFFGEEFFRIDFWNFGLTFKYTF